MVRIDTGYEGRKARVEIIPLVDVVFLLLTAFIYAMLSMTVHRGLKVNLPQAAAAAVEKAEAVTVTIAADGRLFADNEQVDERSLVGAVRRRLAQGAARRVIINGDRDAQLGRAVQVLDLLLKAGISEVSIQCRKPGE